MRTRQTLAATVAVALLLVTAGCVGSLDGTAAASQPDSGDSSIQVSADGQSEAEPDQVVLRVAVTATADDANAVRERIATDAASMREALDESGIGDDQIRTVAFDIRQERDQKTDEPAGYTGIHAFEITISDVNATGAVIDTVVQNGADQVDDVQFTLSDERRRELREAALRDAMANARADAEVIADSANLTITGVDSASTANVNVRPYRAGVMTTEAASADQSTNVESGPVTVTAQVQATYNATAA